MAHQIRQYHDRRAEHHRIKSLASDPQTQKFRRDPPDESQYDRDDRTSRSDTPTSCPSMTHCSSRSAASSITAYEHVADAGQYPACQNLSDVENCTDQNSDGEYVLQFLQTCQNPFCGGLSQILQSSIAMKPV